MILLNCTLRWRSGYKTVLANRKKTEGHRLEFRQIQIRSPNSRGRRALLYSVAIVHSAVNEYFPGVPL